MRTVYDAWGKYCELMDVLNSCRGRCAVLMLLRLCSNAGQQKGTWYIAVATVTIGY
jgi:hypothetical protein